MIKFKDYTFECPHCNHQLNNHEGNVIFQTRFGDDLENTGTIFLSPVIGEYQYRHEPAHTFKHGTHVQFNCPSCKESLTSSKNEDFVQILMKVTSKIGFDVFFSRKAGMHKTFVATENGPESYGDGGDEIEDL